ncbi:methyl-accepting chemotaxis protein [Lacrimispora sp. JR3]|uniref:methyl-accepting chemotaxis protein n=1 Tax=Lacrimispora sinapis TaxID=3111456 RepID=UPI00374854FD
MKNLSVSKKLAVSFSTILALFIITVVISVFVGLHTVTGSFKQFVTSPFTVTNTVNNMRRQLQGIQKDMSYIIIDDVSNRQTWIDDLNSRVVDFENSLTKIEPLLMTDGGKQLVQEVKSEWDKLQPMKEKFMSSLDGKDIETSKKILLDEYYPASLTLVDLTKKLIDDSNDVATYFYNEAQTLAQSVLIISIILFVVSLIFGVMLCLYIIRSITKPLKEIEAASCLLADGNLNANITYESKDEFGTVANSFRTVFENLRIYIFDISEKLGEISKGNLDLSIETNYKNDFLPIKESLEHIIASQSSTFSQIAISADQVNSGAEQMSSSSQILASGATEQAATVEELNASIASVTEQAEQNVKFVEVASNYVLDAESGINNSNKYMQKLNTAMKGIGESSAKISNITKVIEDIAFQTNILALNAAVESARAGEAGKGFAVVADEVRNLAAKSAEAAKQTSDLIQNSVSTVLEGEKLADETGRVLQEVADKALRAVDAIKKIEEFSNAQALTIEEINHGLSQVSAVVQSNAATAEESSASSEELSAQAHTLKQEVNKFKIKKNTLGGEFNPKLESKERNDGFNSDNMDQHGKY